MQVVILAGGKATRLYPLTTNIPKSLITVYGKPFLEYQIQLLKQNNINEILLCVGTFSEQIIEYFEDGKKFGVDIQYSIENPDNLLGTGGALKNAEKYLKDTFFVMYGDSYLTVDLTIVLDEFKKSGKKGLMTIYKNKNRFDKSNIAICDNAVTTYDKSGNTKNLDYIDYGLLVFKKEVINIIPCDKFVNLDFLFNKLIENNELAGYEVKNRFYEIGSINGLKEFENLIKRNSKIMNV